MDNLTLYNKFRTVPDDAKKPITGGRLKGMTDINPMYRIKALTEAFGPCGFGWRYEIVDQRIVEVNEKEHKCFVDIDLYYAKDGTWSFPIRGMGGSSFISNEKNGVYVNDECFKMALTDAIGTACKALGVAADVYWQSDRTKYDQDQEQAQQAQEQAKAYEAVVNQAKAITVTVVDAQTANDAIAKMKALRHVGNSRKETSAIFNARIQELGLLYDKTKGIYYTTQPPQQQEDTHV